MKQYELLTVLPGTLTETELEPKLKKVKELLEDFSAEEIETKNLGKIKMAYQMDGIKYGYYFLYTYNLDPEKNAELEEELNKLSDFLRTMIEHVTPEEKEKCREVDEVRAIQSRDDILDWIEEKKEKREEKESNKKAQKEKTTEDKTEKDEEEETDKRTDTEEEDDVSIEEIDDKLDDILEEEDLSDV